MRHQREARKAALTAGRWLARAHPGAGDGYEEVVANRKEPVSP
jgi:hypothetical protein